MNFSIDAHCELSCDVAVVGGGTAGVFAAISAAKSGADTILIEKNSVLGGTMTVAGVNYPGLFFAWGEQIIDGPAWESILRTAELGGAVLPEISYKPEKHWQEQIFLNRFIYTAVLFDMCKEAGVKVICNSMLSAVFEEDDTLRLLVTDKGGVLAISAKTAIDTTGDGNLCQMAGYQVMKSETLQPATLQNHLSGYDIESVDFDALGSRFCDAGFPDYLTADKFRHFLGIRRIDLHVPCKNADTSLGKTDLDQDAFLSTLKIYKFLRQIPGLESLEIDFIANETGVRETNRILGEHIITADEYINGFLYPDSVCYAFYPIDLHVMTGIEKTYHKDGIVAKVPYRALIPKKSCRILCAGRCISSDTLSNSGVRVEATCMATGQAAGCAAAIAARTGVDILDVPYSDLCNALTKIGAIIPKK